MNETIMPSRLETDQFSKSLRSRVLYFILRDSNYICCLHAMRHSRRIYQAIPVLYRSLEGYSDVYITETHDPEKRRDLNREYPDLTVPVAYTFPVIEDIKFVLDQVFRVDYAFTYSKRAYLHEFH